MPRSFLANITESSSKASRAEACEGVKKWKVWKHQPQQTHRDPQRRGNGSVCPQKGGIILTSHSLEIIYETNTVSIQLSASISYHDVYWWKASQQAAGSEQRRHKRVPYNGTGSEGDESSALGAQRLKSIRVVHVSPLMRCAQVRGRPPPHCGCQ